MTATPDGQQPEARTPREQRAAVNGASERAAVLAVLGVAAVLRLYHLSSQFWFDEISAVINNIRRPFSDLLLNWNGPANHALVEALSHATIATLGESPFAARLPAAAFGVAGVWAIYALVRELTVHRYALTAAALLAVSYHHVFYSQNARGYTALIFFFLVATRVVVRAWQAGSLRPRAAVVYAVATVFAAWSQFSGVIIAPAQFLVVAGAAISAGTPARRAFVARFGAAAIASLLLAALIFAPYLGRLTETARANAAAPAEGSRLGTGILTELIEGLSAAFFGPLGLIAALLVALVGIAAWWRRHRFALAVLVVPVLLQLLVLAALGLGVHPRYVIIALPVGLLVAGAGIVTIVRGVTARFARMAQDRALELALLCGIVLLSATPLRGHYRIPKQDFLGAIAAVDRAAAPGDARVAVQLVDRAVNGYYGKNWLRADDLAELQSIEQSGSRVYAVTTLERLLAIEDPALHAHLQRNYRKVATYPGTVGDGAVHVYLREQPSAGAPAR